MIDENTGASLSNERHLPFKLILSKKRRENLFKIVDQIKSNKEPKSIDHELISSYSRMISKIRNHSNMDNLKK